MSNASNLMDSFFVDYIPLAFGASDMVLLFTMIACVILLKTNQEKGMDYL